MTTKVVALYHSNPDSYDDKLNNYNDLFIIEYTDGSWNLCAFNVKAPNYIEFLDTRSKIYLYNFEIVEDDIELFNDIMQLDTSMDLDNLEKMNEYFYKVLFYRNLSKVLNWEADDLIKDPTEGWELEYKHYLLNPELFEKTLKPICSDWDNWLETNKQKHLENNSKQKEANNQFIPEEIKSLVKETVSELLESIVTKIVEKLKN